jgi:hypothetical protein
MDEDRDSSVTDARQRFIRGEKLCGNLENNLVQVHQSIS